MTAAAEIVAGPPSGSAPGGPWGEPAWFVYGLLPAGARAPDVAAILPESRVEARPAAGLAVLASRVARRLFDRDDAANRTADPDWMSARVQAYHAVNAAVAGPVLPLAFGTLFSDLDRLESWLAPRAERLRAALAGLTGKAEWRLALHADPIAHDAWLDGHDPTLRALRAACAGAGAGTAFLMTRRLDKARMAARARHAAEAASAITTLLAAAAAAAGFFVLTQPRGRDDSIGMLSPSPSVLASWTVLAPQGVAGGGQGGAPDRTPHWTPDWATLLEPMAANLAPDGLALRLTGPWPAYAFARVLLDEERAHG